MECYLAARYILPIADSNVIVLCSCLCQLNDASIEVTTVSNSSDLCPTFGRKSRKRSIGLPSFFTYLIRVGQYEPCLVLNQLWSISTWAACISLTIIFFLFLAIRLMNSLQVVEDRYKFFPLPGFPHCAMCVDRNRSNSAIVSKIGDCFIKLPFLKESKHSDDSRNGRPRLARMFTAQSLFLVHFSNIRFRS